MNAGLGLLQAGCECLVVLTVGLIVLWFVRHSRITYEAGMSKGFHRIATKKDYPSESR